jgi:DNA-directed RNA polymerase specialized sigma subunit
VKIALNLMQNDPYAAPDANRERAIERDIADCKRNDWEAKTRLIQTFMPLMTSLARKRTQDTAEINRYIEAGKEGLLKAARQYRPGTGVKFEIFLLTYLEARMDRVDRPGLWARLLGRH